ncbi:NifU N-terminal domain-containing protein [Miltoncostaea marina]|uniref:NifU N-terminal domain-containing protein n=1 Tax=Miltoncostaea marina TaxID=2843215 RepID=UPI001C3DC041|nr:NifU N-terminal domain-containing protein [Miltoncostaea marina]
MIDVTPEPTPNPNAVKFTLDRPSTEGRPVTFREGSDPADSPLGARIFALGGVTNVFMTANFVSVTKEAGADWQELVPRVIDELQAHFGGDAA